MWMSSSRLQRVRITRARRPPTRLGFSRRHADHLQMASRGLDLGCHAHGSEHSRFLQRLVSGSNRARRGSRPRAGSIRVVTPTYFCATKIAAFHGRGNRDFAGSHDLEDLLAVVDGRKELFAEIRAAADDVRNFLAAEMRAFLNLQAFLDMLPGSLMPDPASQARLPLLVSRLQAIASLE